ncbi:MAG: hypothetical protein KGM95_05590 [Betaproteobacteria bacterium]|nr:hypothetical protein [Betaproteobacteria bacterium]
MKSTSGLPNESRIREEWEDESTIDELEDESAVDEREEEDDEDEDEGDEEEIYQKAIRTVEIHERNLDLLYSGAGMYWLGMSIGWKAFRILHTRRSSSAITVRGITRHLLTFSPCGSY